VQGSKSGLGSTVCHAFSYLDGNQSPGYRFTKALTQNIIFCTYFRS